MRLAASPVKRSSDWVLQLINIVFLLLLFFLVNGTIAGPQDTGVEPPHSVLIAAGNPPRDAAYIDQDGNVRYRQAPASPEQIARQLRSDAAALGLAGETLPPLVIVADRRLKASRLVASIEELKRLGVRNISLLTVQDETP
jgi:biopolymer transport protein ExbD